MFSRTKRAPYYFYRIQRAEQCGRGPGRWAAATKRKCFGTVLIQHLKISPKYLSIVNYTSVGSQPSSLTQCLKEMLYAGSFDTSMVHTAFSNGLPTFTVLTA